jgi:predicted nucleic acid-binding protein
MINPRILPALLFVSLTASAQPATEIYLFDLVIKKKSVSATKPVNITNHKGYDNQPFFHPEYAQVYYSSFNDDGRSDIRMYDYSTNTSKSITQTQEREYSPTITPDRDHLSCIIQRDSGAQDLGKYPIEGGVASVIIDNLIVGYHVWADNSHLALFVLGTPNTLHYVRLPTKKDTILAENIGRSLHRVPGESAISFVHKVSEQEWIIKKLDTHSMQITAVATTLPGRDDLSWLPDGRILMSDGTALFYLKPGPQATWTKVEVVDGSMLKGVTRLAVSSNGKKLAVVVTEE